MRVAIVDYESGNLHSARKAFERASREGGTNAAIEVTADPERVRIADCRAGLDAVPDRKSVV